MPTITENERQLAIERLRELVSKALDCRRNLSDIKYTHLWNQIRELEARTGVGYRDIHRPLSGPLTGETDA